MPAVSVIIPVYKVEPYMARCARSLFGQTLPDIEFLFIDDCSPDRSIDIMREVLEEFPQRKEQVVVYRMPHNSGQAAVRMQGLALARGEYVIHCDSDDYVDVNAYATLYWKAKAEDLDVVTCNLATVEQDGRVIEQIRGEYTSVARMLEGKERWNLVNRLVRRTLCEDLTAPVSNVGEDMLLCVQIQLKARRTGHVDRTLYFYCIREDSITNQKGQAALVTRWESLENARILLRLLVDRYGYTGDEPEIVHFKYKCRRMLHPLVHIPEYYRRWKEIYPEVDRRILSLPTLSLEEKFWYVLIRLRLYHPVKWVTGWFRSLRARPNP